MGIWLELGVFGLAFAFAAWQFYDLKREREKRQARQAREAREAQAAREAAAPAAETPADAPSPRDPRA